MNVERADRAPAAPQARVFHTLDLLRGIAALGVVVFHMRSVFAPLATRSGYLAVDLFFMMSGVVLSHAYEHRFQAGMGTFAFMRVRFIRLYPLYLLGTLFGIAVTLASLLGRNINHWDPSSLSRAVALALLGLPDFLPAPVNDMFPLDIPCWSLFQELVVNLLFVLFWPLLASRRLMAVCLVTGAAVLWAVLKAGNLDQGSPLSSFPVGLARSAFGFSVGVLIARGSRAAPRAQNDLRVLAIVGGVVIALTGWAQGELRVLWDAGCVLVVFPLTIYAATRVDPGTRVRLIATFLGLTSYAVYVLHTPLASVVNSAARHVSANGPAAVGAPYLGLVVLGFLLGGCWLIDRYFDTPIRRRLSQFLARKS